MHSCDRLIKTSRFFILKSNRCTWWHHSAIMSDARGPFRTQLCLLVDARACSCIMSTTHCHSLSRQNQILHLLSRKKQSLTKHTCGQQVAALTVWKRLCNSSLTESKSRQYLYVKVCRTKSIKHKAEAHPVPANGTQMIRSVCAD